MKKELDNFTITSNIDIEYFDNIVRYILENENKIFEFFRLKQLPHKFNIIIMSYDSFKNEQIKRYGKVIGYIRGITNGSTYTIMILNIDDQIKYTTHKDATLDNTLRMIMHEIVHACNSLVNKDNNQTTWFREGLATNLADQNYSLIDLTECDFDLLKSDFHNTGDSYNFAYTIVHYILDSYDQEEVFKLIVDSDYLRKKQQQIFDEAKEYVLKKLLKR